MKFSIVTVCYNSAATIADTLESVNVQSHPDLEHIIVDGASTDATLDVVKAVGRRVSRVISEPDRGLYDAMNKGIAAARGDYIGFLNSDDLFASPDAVAWMAQAARVQAPDALYGDLVYVRQDRTDTVVRHWRSGTFSPAQLRLGWMPPHPTFYLRREVFEQVGGFDPALRISADYELMLRCLTRPGFRTAYVPQVLVRMRMGGVSNPSLSNLIRRGREDLAAVRRNRVGGLATLILKTARKLPQLL